MVGAFWIDKLRSGSSGELAAYWGIRNSLAPNGPSPVVLVRKANYLCLLEDSPGAGGDERRFHGGHRRMLPPGGGLAPGRKKTPRWRGFPAGVVFEQ